MIRKLKSGGYRLYSRKINPKTGRRRNLGTFETRWRPKSMSARCSTSSATEATTPHPPRAEKRPRNGHVSEPIGWSDGYASFHNQGVWPCVSLQ